MNRRAEVVGPFRSVEREWGRAGRDSVSDQKTGGTSVTDQKTIEHEAPEIHRLSSNSRQSSA